MASGGEREIVLVRHGETEWTLSGRHTSHTDVPLTDDGRKAATALGARLRNRTFGLVLTSPMVRARETCALAGFGDGAAVDADLCEWDYGDAEGHTTAQIRETIPNWTVWAPGPIGGETIDAVAARADRVLARAADVDGDVLLLGHGHLLRVLGARWLGLPPIDGRLLALDPASISVLDHEREQRVLRSWNVTA